jgi:hypothetical protein
MTVRLNITMDDALYVRLKRMVPPGPSESRAASGGRLLDSKQLHGRLSPPAHSASVGRKQWREAPA